MILRSPTEHENADRRHAGMDGRHPGSRDAPETSMSIWIPALHAGMTQEVLLQMTEAPTARIFQGAHEGHEDQTEKKESNLKKLFPSCSS
jgi:hypothetical protein